MANSFAVWNVSSSSGAPPTGSSSTAGQLGKNDFLNLLAAQLRQQNPLDPVDNAQFMAQTAQFNTLEQLQKMNETLEAAMGMNALSQASTLIGRQVIALNTDNTRIEGIVKEVTLQDGKPMLLVGDTAVPLDNVVVVGAAPDA